MPDLDTELAALRHRMRDTIDQPDLVDIAARARARTTRRRTQWAAMAAVLVVAATVPLLRGAVPTGTPVGQLPDRPVIAGHPYVMGLDFVTPERGYATESNCTPGARGADCRYDLLTTTDGGRSWKTRPLPSTADGRLFTRLQAMYVIGENEVVIDRTTPDDRNERIHSVDGGQTWSVVAEPIMADSSPTISTAGGLVTGCPPLIGPTDVRCANVATILPDGRTSLLVTQPPVDYPVPAFFPTTEGTWWVSGQDPATADLALAVSRDAGRTWTASTLGLPVDESWLDSVSVAEHDGTLYASVSDTDAQPVSALTAMFVSTDGGRNWTRTREFAEDDPPRSMVGELVVTPSGELLVNSLFDDRKTYATTDGGATFTEAEHQFAGIVYRVRTGYVVAPWRQVKTDYRFSADGGEWRTVTVG